MNSQEIKIVEALNAAINRHDVAAISNLMTEGKITD